MLSRTLLLATFCLFAAGNATSTELWIQPRDESGKMLRLSRASEYPISSSDPKAIARYRRTRKADEWDRDLGPAHAGGRF
jgi:hypothetical protein